MRAIHPIVVGGSLAGVLDISAAFVLSAGFGNTPLRVLQGIASGILGAKAFAGGIATAALGLALHFVIAFSAAAVYYLVSRRVASFRTRPLAWGATYGVIVWALMAYLVIPLSRVAPRTQSWPLILTVVLIHIACVGLPIGLATAREESRRADVVPAFL